MRAIDTNVLVRLIVRDNPAQVAAAELFIEKGAWVSVLALAEACWVWSSVYGLTAKQIAEVVEMILDHHQLTVQDSDLVQSALSLFKSKPALGFSDCLMVKIATRAGHKPLGTFDRALGKVDGAVDLSATRS